MDLNSDLNNIKMWKATSIKRHDSYVCMPKIGTPWVNRLSDISGQTSSSERFILSDTFGDKMGLSARELSYNYRFYGSGDITFDTLKDKIERDLIDWIRVEAKSTGVYWAFHLNQQKYGNTCRNYPVQTCYGIVIANKAGVQHGVGDFLVCKDRNGRPDFSTIKVVNGKLFVLTYDMRAFPGVVDGGTTSADAPKPATIFTPEQRTALDKERRETTKRELASQLEQCYDVLGMFSSTVLLLYFGVFISKLNNGNPGLALLSKTHLDGGNLSTNISETVVACGSSVLRFDTGNRIIVRTAISKKNQMACNLQFIDNKGAVLNGVVSNNTDVCIEYLFFIKKYKEQIDSLLHMANTDLESGGANLVSYAKKLMQSSNKDILNSFIICGYKSFLRCLTEEMADRKGDK